MAAFPWGALISAGGSLLGGMLSGSDADYMKKYNKKKIQWTVKDAQKAGIHPLAALGSPIAGSFAAPTGGQALGDAVGDAAATIGAGITRSENIARSREADNLNKELLRSQIRSIDAGTAKTLAEATSRTSIKRVRDLTQGGALQTPGSQGGVKLRKGQTDVDEFEQRLGELGGMVETAGATGRAMQDNTDWMLNSLNDLLRGIYLSSSTKRAIDKHGRGPIRAYPDYEGPQP